MAVRPRRSALYLPASNPRALVKARTLPCDVVILDLEDAVAPEAKAGARDAAVAAVREGGWGRRELVVRVNALATEWGEADCAALVRARPDAVLVPKVGMAADVAGYAERFGGLSIWAMVETLRAVADPFGLAAAPGLGALVMGTNDLAKEARMRPGADRLPLAVFLAQAVAATRLVGVPILDGVYNAIADTAGFARECEQGVQFGFDGKTLIHPSQIDACNAAFSPGADEVRWAERVVAAFAPSDAAGRGVLRVDGQMVERLHLEQAEQVLALARAIEGEEA